MFDFQIPDPDLLYLQRSRSGKNTMFATKKYDMPLANDPSHSEARRGPTADAVPAGTRGERLCPRGEERGSRDGFYGISTWCQRTIPPPLTKGECRRPFGAFVKLGDGSLERRCAIPFTEPPHNAAACVHGWERGRQPHPVAFAFFSGKVFPPVKLAISWQ